MPAAIYLVATSYMRLPFGDLWDVTNYVARPDGSLLHYLWLQHNEHRIFFPKLVLLLDYWWFGAADIFPLILNLLLQMAIVSLLLWALRDWGKLQGPQWRTAVGMALLCGFCTSQWENFISGFQISFILGVFFFVVATLLLLVRPPRCATGPEWRRVILSILAGIAATYSAANGILVWPILIAIALVQRWRRAVVLSLASGGVIATGSYLYDYHSPPSHADPLTTIRSPGAILAYVVKYVGGPLDWGHPGLAAVFGAVGLGGAAVTIWYLLRRRNQPIATFCTALLLFVTGSGLLTALGRLSFGTNQALSSRYETLVLLFWLALGVALLTFVVRQSAPRLLALQAPVLLIILLAIPRMRYPLHEADKRALDTNTTSLAFLTGVEDKAQLRKVSPFPGMIWSDLPAMRQKHLSIFATRLAADWGKPLGMAYRVRSAGCWGGVESVTRIDTQGNSGLRISGWAWDRPARRPVTQIIFTVDGKIEGYAEPGYYRPDLQMRMGARSASRSGWVGYVSGSARATPISVYASVAGAGNQVCRVDYVPPDATFATSSLQFSAP